ncbi:MAG TPA: TlpA disulfide reductase family protein [Polyangiaceae bacterium]|jgi:peroxiredoxin|nr:TlpA disulfide reductase family protein [Polyangiaceae bacterium]
MGHRLPVLIAVALAASACGAPAGMPGAATSAPAASSTPTTAVPVPAIALSTLAGEHTDLARLAGGRVALVSLWATWCESCAKEMDALNRLDAKTAAGRDAVVIGVDVGEEPAMVAAFARRRGLRYTQLVDEDFAFADALGQRRVPSTLVVDRRGRIVFRGDALDGKSLEALRQAIAAGP